MGLKYGVDFTIEPLPKRSYNVYRQNKRVVKPSATKYADMGNQPIPKQFKHTAEVREFMRQTKAKQRAKTKAKEPVE